MNLRAIYPSSLSVFLIPYLILFILSQSTPNATLSPTGC
jgi:hypothetical protein